MTRVRIAETVAGRRLEVSTVVAASAADAWDAIVDTTRWPEWSPIVCGVESTDRRLRRGTTGRVRLPGVWLPFRITSCADRRWTWRVVGVPAAGHRVDDLGENRCRIAFELPPAQAGYAPISLRSLENVETLLEDDEAIGR
ncbi:SRPBCC family protein [Natrinema sp. 74]|uniref:SRPBCC family protein n=1 Tax=Natrinema sp. 74 TaxID=3384159 RepID=UPI0038D511DF